MRKRINRIIGLSCITVLCMCIFASCVKKPSPNEESSAAEEKSTQSGDNKASDISTLSEVTSYSDDQMINYLFAMKTMHAEVVRVDETTSVIRINNAVVPNFL